MTRRNNQLIDGHHSITITCHHGEHCHLSLPPYGLAVLGDDVDYDDDNVHLTQLKWKSKHYNLCMFAVLFLKYDVLQLMISFAIAVTV